jgi:predicted RNase H-like HicB family nuclease
MSTEAAPFEYRVVVKWSGEDDAFAARVPALPGCAAYGRSPESATREAVIAARSIIEISRTSKKLKRALIGGPRSKKPGADISMPLDAAANVERLTRHVVAVIRGEEGDHVRDIIAGFHPTHRHLALEEFPRALAIGPLRRPYHL